MQCSRFTNGGFVLHKVAIDGRKYSAWFDASGNLLDAEQVNGAITRPVQARHTNIRTRLAFIGKVWNDPR